MSAIKLPAKVRSHMRKGSTFNDCVYIYSDGICYLERKEIPIPGTDAKTTVDVAHIIPCVVQVRSNNWEWELKRLVLHRPELIANGFDRIDIYFNNRSQSMKDKGLTATTVTFRSGCHEWQETEVEGLLGGSVTVQPNPISTWGNTSGIGDSVNEWQDISTTCILYD